jgi:hypothetical protein
MDAARPSPRAGNYGGAHPRQYGTQVPSCGKAPCRAAAALRQLKEHGDFWRLSHETRPRRRTEAGARRVLLDVVQAGARWHIAVLAENSVSEHEYVSGTIDQPVTGAGHILAVNVVVAVQRPIATFWRKIHVFGARLAYSKIKKPRRERLAGWS